MRTMDTEKCVIDARAANSGIITCIDDIEHFHYGDTNPTDLDGIDLRSEVVLLDRNITIKAADPVFMGCRIHVANWIDTGFITSLGIQMRQGKVNMDYVQVKGCSQDGTYNSALKF